MRPRLQDFGWVVALVLASLAPGAAAADASGSEALRASIERYVRERAPHPPDAVVVPDLEGLARFVSPRSQVELSSHPRTRFEGQVPITVVLREGARELHRAVVSVSVTSQTTALVAARRLERGQELRADDFRAETRERASLPEGWLREAAQAVGMRLGRSLRPGQPLRAAWLEIPPRVSRGQIVQIRMQRGPLRIEARGEARSDGREGDWIRVLNRDSRRELHARVVGDGVVHVEF